jgi:glycosyltransferase involved in cell wall biosynthesis
MGFLVPTYYRLIPSVAAPTLPRFQPAFFENECQARDIVSSGIRPVGVLHLINGEHFSGAERVQQLLGKRLPEQCIDPHFVCLKQGKFPEFSGLDPESVRVISMKSRFDFSIVQRIAEHAAERSIELIHAHTPRSAMIASLVAHKLSRPWVFHVHSPTARDSTRSWINRVNDGIERLSLRNCDHIITVSKSLRREMLSRGHSRTKVSCIPNGVAVQTPIDPLARINNDTWTLGMVALVRPRKGIEVLLDALKIVRSRTSQVQLEVVGPFETPAYESQVFQQVERLGLGDVVKFRGFTNDVPQAMRGFDGMVLPSLFGEGMPMVVLESLALGVPVIATRVEGTPEVVRHGREGYLAEPQNADSLAEEILRFISSRSYWTQMSANAVQRHADRFCDVDMAARTAKVYRRVLHHFEYGE